MSQHCPLCGKDKPENELFCTDCGRKIRKGYEVNIPEQMEREIEIEPEKEIYPQPEEPQEAEIYIPQPKKKNRFLKSFLITVVSVAVLGFGGFYVYKNIIAKGNVERTDWEIATKENSVKSYLTYLDKHPDGKYSVEAMQNMTALRTSEAEMWEKLKQTDNTAELQDFLRRYPQSAYIPLVKPRLDSLIWDAALKTNTCQSYSEYIQFSEDGVFRGNYIAEAQKRQKMLRQEYPVKSGELDSLRNCIDGFYIALSDVNHTRLTEYFSPVVTRFFTIGTVQREKIVSHLLVEGAKTPVKTIKFEPDLLALVYEKNGSGNFICNVPVVKNYTDAAGKSSKISGYIAHFELNADYAITSVYESKPSAVAP